MSRNAWRRVFLIGLAIADPAHDLTFVTLATDSQVSLPVSEAILDAFIAND